MDHIFQRVDGWFTFPKLYSTIVSKAVNGSVFAEVGAWKGKSACYMAVEIVNSGKNIKFDVIDTWEGSDELMNNPSVMNNTLYTEFLSNIEPVKDVINPIRSTSLEASKLYEDSSLDFVFIDASHDYENVKADINAWYPKVKSGGVLAGHDYYPGNEGGVIQAVDEFTRTHNYTPMLEEACWSIVKK
jgi:hypothetical protein